MKILQWKVYYSLGIIGLSILLYVSHFFIFGDPEHIFIFLISDLAFLPLYILVTTLGLHALITRKEKGDLARKLNMIVGTFYSEIGSKLLNHLRKFEPDTEEINKNILREMEWSAKELATIKKQLLDFNYIMECNNKDLKSLKNFLLKKRNFLLVLLENPVILELTSFSDMLWVIFHLIEELEKIPTKKVANWSEDDFNHLNEDIKATYIFLVMEWLDYMKILKLEDPYLFSLALRANPFDPDITC